MTQDYLTELDQSGRYSPGTLVLTAQWLERLEQWAAGSLNKLTPADLDRWHHELTWKPGPSGNLYSESTRSQAIGVVRRFFVWAVLRGHLASNPAAHLQTPVVPSRPRPMLDPGQARRLLDAPDLHSLAGIRDRAVLGVVLETRASRPACARLDLDHLQLDTGALLTQGRSRQVHSLSDELLTDLSRYLDFVRPALAGAGQSALFVSLQGKRLSAPAIRQLIRHHADRAGVPRP